MGKPYLGERGAGHWGGRTVSELAWWYADQRYERRVEQARLRMQAERDAMSDEEKQRERRANIERCDRIIAKNRERAERERLSLPWTDPHFVNILKRTYRNYLKRKPNGL